MGGTVAASKGGAESEWKDWILCRSGKEIAANVLASICREWIVIHADVRSTAIEYEWNTQQTRRVTLYGFSYNRPHWFAFIQSHLARRDELLPG